MGNVRQTASLSWFLPAALSQISDKLAVCRTAVWRNVVLLLLPLMLLAGCRQDMHNQPKYLPLRPSEFFADGQSSRKPVDGTVARGSLDNDVFIPAKTGVPAGQASPAAPAATGGNQKSAAAAGTQTGAGSFPFPITSEVLARGEERFNINCSPCHGRTGYGDGMIVRRGFPQPPSYHIDRLRSAPDAHFYDVMTNGFGRMPTYADQVSPRDRWMIIAYIRALQLSQNATVADVPADQQPQLNQKGQTR
ncbi:MAG: cytochrome c [Blastocatellia bacterium]